MTALATPAFQPASCPAAEPARGPRLIVSRPRRKRRNLNRRGISGGGPHWMVTFTGRLLRGVSRKFTQCKTGKANRGGRKLALLLAFPAEETSLLRGDLLQDRRVLNLPVTGQEQDLRDHLRGAR